ncbi:MAG: hypothetical protein J6Q35_03455 [Rikenellaceae bacterium]|nr:hypothetical protein [Rikenellaceae bacterium]
MRPEDLLKYVSEYYTATQYPTLHEQIRQWSETRPLAGLRILDSTPVFRNTLLKYAALLAGGAELEVGISECISRDESVVEFLQSNGVAVVAPNECGGVYDVVMDCGAIFADRQTRYGYVELTRSGVPKYEQRGATVFMADSGVIKRIETILGTGDGYFRAMAELGYDNWSGVRLTVFGSGNVGCGIILQAHRLGACINVVTDPATLSPKYRTLCHQVVDYRDAQRVVEVLSESDAVVTATGKCSVVEQYVDKQFFNDKKCLLANMGVEDELGEAIPADMVLNGKSALNFMLEEPTHLKFIDATMALHNLGALYLVENKDLSGVILPPEQMEQGLLDTTRKFGEIGDILNNIFDWVI